MPRKTAEKKLMFLETHSADQLSALGKQVTMGATAEEGKLLMKWMGGSQPSRMAKTRGQNRALDGIMHPGTSSASGSGKKAAASSGRTVSSPKKTSPKKKVTPKKKPALKKTTKTTPTKKTSTKGKKKLMFLQTHTPGELAALGKQMTMGATAEEGQALMKWMGEPKARGRTRQSGQGTSKTTKTKKGKK